MIVMIASRSMATLEPLNSGLKRPRPVDGLSARYLAQSDIDTPVEIIDLGSGQFFRPKE
jgi:hypothetical protein